MTIAEVFKQEGLEKGREEGKLIGFEEGKAQILRKMVLTLSKEGVSPDQIVKLTELLIEEVKKIIYED